MTIGNADDFDVWERMPRWEAESRIFEDLMEDEAMLRASALALVALCTGFLSAFFWLA